MPNNKIKSFNLSDIQYKTLAENSIQGIVIASGPPPQFLYVNKAMAKMLGYSQSEMENFTPEQIVQIVHPDDREMFFKRFKERINGENVDANYNIKGIHKNGTVKHFEICSTLIKDPKKPIVQAVFRDLTDEQHSKDNLDFERKQALSIYNSINECIYVIDPETYTILFANNYFKKLFQENPIGKKCYEVIEDNKIQCPKCPHQKLKLEPDKTYKRQFDNIKHNKHFLVHEKIIRWIDGRNVIIELAIDITEQTKINMEISIISDLLFELVNFPIDKNLYEFISIKLKNLIPNSIIALNSYNEEENVLKLENILGIDKKTIESIISQNKSDKDEIKFPNISTEIIQKLKTANLNYLGNDLYTCLFGVLDKNVCNSIKEQYNINHIYSIGINSKNKLMGNLTILSSSEMCLNKNFFEVLISQIAIIAEKREHEKALIESEKKYREFADHLPQAVCEIDTTGKIYFVNKICYEKFGYIKEDFQHGLDALEMIAPKEREKAKINIGKILAGKMLGYNEYTALTKDGKKFPVIIYSSPIKKDNKVLGFRSLIVDITERKKYEQFIKAQNKLSLKILKTEDLKEIIDDALDIILETTALDCGGVYIFNEKLETLDLFTHRGLSDNFIKKVSHYEVNSLSYQLVLKGKILYEKYDELPVEKSKTQIKEGLKAILIAPIHYREKVIGCVNIASKKAAEIPTESRDFIESILAQIGIAIYQENIRQALISNEAKYKNLFHNAQVALFRTRIEDGKCLECNNLMAKLLGYSSREECIEKYIAQEHYVDSNARETILKDLDKYKQIGNIEALIKLDNGTEKWVAYSGKIFPELGYIEGAAIDITEEKKAKEALLESETRFRELFNNMSPGVAVYEAYNNGEDFIFKDFNKGGEIIEGINKNDVIGRKVSEVFPGVFEFGLFDVFKRVYKSGIPEHHPIRFYHDTNTQGWRENYVYKLPTGEVVAVYEDVTDKMNALKALNESVENFKALADNASDGILLANGGGQHVYANLQASIITGFSISELLKMKEQDLAYIGDSEKVKKYTFKRMQQKPVTGQYEVRIKTKNNIIIPIEISAAKTTWKGHPVSMAIFRDISVRKIFEKRLEEIPKKIIQAQESERSKISRDIHDDLGQELVALKLALQSMMANKDKCKFNDSEKQHTINILDSIINKTRNIALGLRPTVIDNLGLNSAIEYVIAEFQAKYNLNIDSIVPNLKSLEFKGEKINFFRIIQEALFNIVKHSEAKTTSIKIDLINDLLKMSISDNGKGFDINELKGDNEFCKIGLGIETMKERASLLFGNFNIISKIGKGTEIKISLPIKRK
ncbi:MAG: PAS domain S-box protein [Pseudomonadota bacterium]